VARSPQPLPRAARLCSLEAFGKREENCRGRGSDIDSQDGIIIHAVGQDQSTGRNRYEQPNYPETLLAVATRKRQIVLVKMKAGNKLDGEAAKKT